jgi:cytochrome c-type protein NapB
MLKRTKLIALSLVAGTALFVGCASDDNVSAAKKVSSEQLSYRSAPLNANVETPKVVYSNAAAGTSKKIKRAFQDAPPMIPHSVEGMLPITKDNNQCITCHVDSAPYDKSIPSVPVSHMTNFRPDTKIAKDGEIEKNGKVIVNSSSEKLADVSIKSTGGKLYPGRFNCSQCHAPQAQNVKLLTDNKFQPEYTSKDGAFKSSWDDKKFMEDIDTTK